MVKLFQVFCTLFILLLFISDEVYAGNVDGNNDKNSSVKIRKCRQVIGPCSDECDDDCCDRICWIEFMGPLEGTGRCIRDVCVCYYNC
ncbi:hypothetical protein GQ457_18G004640 [Hibiscus cannabinus]